MKNLEIKTMVILAGIVWGVLNFALGYSTSSARIYQSLTVKELERTVQAMVEAEFQTVPAIDTGGVNENP